MEVKHTSRKTNGSHKEERTEQYSNHLLILSTRQSIYKLLWVTYHNQEEGLSCLHQTTRSYNLQVKHTFVQIYSTALECLHGGKSYDQTDSFQQLNPGLPRKKEREKKMIHVAHGIMYKSSALNLRYPEWVTINENYYCLFIKCGLGTNNKLACNNYYFIMP